MSRSKFTTVLLFPLLAVACDAPDSELTSEPADSPDVTVSKGVVGLLKHPIAPRIPGPRPTAHPTGLGTQVEHHAQTLECNSFTQDCPNEGEKCVPFADDGGGAWNSLGCFAPIVGSQPAGVGEPCQVEASGVSGVDNCVEGSMCWDVDPNTLEGTCIELCSGTPEDPHCGEGTTCGIYNEGVLSLCMDACDPLDLTACDDEICVSLPSGTFACIIDASGDEGQLYDPCSYANACDAGLRCMPASAAPECDPSAEGCCLPFCDLDDPNPCPGALECEPWFEQGQAPDGLEDVGYCTGLYCGDGNVDPGELCDDGNQDPNDACLPNCVPAICGDGFVHGGVEQCDDANFVDGDGCAQCKAAVDDLYAAGGTWFKHYSVSEDAWTPKPNLLATLGSSLTNDGTSVYYADNTNDHKIYKYDGTSWSVAPIPAVSAAADSTTPGGNNDYRDLLTWFDGGFYYLNNYRIDSPGQSKYELWVYRTNVGQWALITSGETNHVATPINGTPDNKPDGPFDSAQWDRTNRRLFLKFYHRGFAILDTTAGSPTQDTIVQWRYDDPNNFITDGGHDFAFSSGKLYRWSSNSIREYYQQFGAWQVTTPITVEQPTNKSWDLSWSGISFINADTDHASGAIYLLGNGGSKFKRLDPVTHSVKILDATNLSSPELTVMRPQ